MNKIFKVVKNQRTGNSVVASEFAKGAKKGKKLALLSLAMLMGCGLSVSAPAADPAGQWLETEYRPAQYDSTTKTWVNNSNEKEQSRVINDGSVKDLNLNNEKTKFTNNLDYHETWFSLQELWAKNTDANKVISITEYRDGVAVPGDASLNAIEDWQVPDNPSAMEEITWKKEDGEIAVMQAYNTDAFKKNIDPQLGVYLLEKQPELSPFYHLTLAEVKDGTLNMTAADNVDWDINYIKDSSLFVAAADSGKSATIDTTSKLHVTFGEAYGMYLSSGEYKYTFQPQNELVESVAIPKELNGFTSKGKTYALGDTFAIGNAQGLAAYNALLIDAVTHNVLPGAEYKALIEATVVPRPQDKDYFDVNIDLKGLEDKDIRLNDAITANIGRRSIFEAAGEGSVLNIKDGADIRGETSSNSGRYRAYHIFAHDGAKVFHDATTSVPNYKGQNALIDNAEFTNRGTLLLGDGKTRIYGDQVTGENAHYTNLGTIAVEAFNLVNNDPTDKDVIANTGVTASGGSLVTNEKGGKLLLGQKGIGKNEGTVTGVQVKGASFINNGDILMGKDDVSLSGGREDDTWDMRIMSNAVAALLDETAKAGEKYAIENKGKIDINKGVSNAVGINVASTPNRNADSQLTVVNNGEIDVAGTNTVGMRVSGTNRVKDVIENNGTINVSGAGSIGLLALGDSTITHHGQVIATNNGTTTGGTKPARTTGVRADDAKVIIDGGTVELKGNNTVGVFARVGGEIDLNSGHVIFDKNSVNQTGYWIAGRKGADETFSSRINFGASDVALTLDNNDSTLFRVDQKAQFLGDSSKGTTYTFDINGEKSRGFYIADNGTEVKTGNMQLNVNGNDATGLYLANGAGADGKVVLDKETTISVTGEGGTIAVIDGNYYDINGNATGKKSDKTTLTSKAHLKSGGTDDNIAKNAIGYKLINGGVLNHDGNIDFSKADNATGIRVETGTVNNTTDITVNGVGVDIYGRNSVVNNTGNITANNGTAAVRLNKDASMTIGGKGKILGENSADAVRAHSGSNVKLDNANIEVTGSGSGLHLLNTDDDSGAFKLSGTGTINVSGENASGLKLEADDGKGGVMMAKSKLDTSGAGGTTINVKDKGGNGIVTNTSGDVISGMNVNIESAEGESALVVLGGTKNITQSGKLTSASDHSVVDLTALRNDFSFTNSGTVTAGASGMAVDAHQNSNIRFTNGGTISGKSVLGGGNNTIALSGNTSDIATGHGDNTIEMLEKAVTGILTAGNGNNTVTLNGGTKLQTGTVGNGQNNVILKNVSEAQSDALFGNLKAGSGGQDALTLQGKASHYVLQDSSKISGFEKLNIEEGRFELRNTDITLNELTADDGITVKQGGELFINQNKADTFAHQLQGDGLVTTSTAGQAFDFNNKSAAFAGDNFTGTLRLTNGTFDIAGDNTRALQKSRLDIGDKSVATVRAGVGTQSFDRLAMSGGTLAFNDNITGSSKADGHISVNSLELDNAKGTVQVKADGFDNLPTPSADNKVPLLEQDEGDSVVQLVNAGKASDYTGGLNLQLTDKDGNVIPSNTKTEQDLRQDGKVVAKGTYDYGLQTSANAGGKADGLYVAYQLTEVDLQGKGSDALVLAAQSGKSGSAANLGAKITGQGDLAIDTASEYVTLSNNSNDYTGSTFVRHGKLRAEADNVLGNTQLLDLVSGTAVELTSTTGAGTEQTAGKLTSAANSLVALGNGKLTVKNGGEVNGSLSGTQAGQLVVNNDTLTVTGANSGMHSAVTIDQPAQVTIRNIAGLGDSLVAVAGTLRTEGAQGLLRNQLTGSGTTEIAQKSDAQLTADNSGFSGRFTTDADSTLRASQAEHIGSAAIENAGTLVLTHNDGKQPWDLTNSVTGAGTLVKQGAGRITLTDKSAQYTGTTEIQNGTLQAGSYDSALVMNSRQVNIGTQGTFAGQGTLKGSVNNAGQFYVGELDKKDLGQATDYRVDGNFVNNGGSIWLASQKETESRLNVGGDFTANGGSITLNTVLNRGHEDTMTDQLVVDGNVYTGKNGATTLNINNVGGEGADTLKQPDAIKVVHVGGKSDKNAFKLGGPVAIGVYEYLLHKGYKDDSWYLDSFDTNVYPPDENKEDPNRNVNPEIGGHMANRMAALGMFSMTLHDRLGEPHYADSFKGDENASSVWLRITGDRQRQDAVSRSLRLKGDTYTTQLGGDIINWNNDAQDTTIRGGIMGAIGKSDYTSSAKRTGTKADAKIDRAYSVGLYGTWYQNREDENNAYADVWAQYSWFDNKVSMAGSSSDYKSRLVSASVETGYSMAVYKPDADKQWLLTPQAQVIFNSYDSDDSSSGTGLVMKGGRSNSVDTRLGARLTYANQKQSDKSAQPFVEVNWLHSTAKSDMTFNKHYTFSDDRPANRFEIKAGVEGQISPNWTVWGNVSHQMGADDYSGDRAMIGVKYQWK
ncbi:TPA: autotransporter outer membrane beta-barrel domain-containing protein [Morganella morganii]|uniref:autotransporter outer membrane beta-barrel domain-containing protein n=1 Tax=Morganella morganii TaxID=582 RepID=UPI0005FB8CAC|nr:autotransporter outer membrane beta-barrel domain-containing protein [Morganella morganii]ELA7678702.1 autotransporter outer membrane beta-barrel domain-containing protein [Morganella morganii]KJY04045.1 Outer membrane protein IcsA autotransporter precursor [Morganella morganii]MBT0359478.1 autotransporter outer membrane beta-barrel domain-containing protein [Morganella morganii subsp. morganii]HCR3551692.1 autotransporter outer membrane beta-barrel domain-containing protein [Morganella morg